MSTRTTIIFTIHCACHYLDVDLLAYVYCKVNKKHHKIFLFYIVDIWYCLDFGTVDLVGESGGGSEAPGVAARQQWSNPIGRQTDF